MGQNDLPLDPSLRRAYTVFIEEVTGRVDEAVRFCSGQMDPESSDIHSLQVGFHRIKGGAGFFGLSEIGRISREIEHLLHSAGQTAGRTVELSSLVSALQKQVLELRVSLTSEQEED